MSTAFVGELELTPPSLMLVARNDGEARLPVVPMCRIPTGIAVNPKSERSSLHPASCRGAFRDRHERGGGMRWTRYVTRRMTYRGRRSRVVLVSSKFFDR